jgi:hypothetical protein
VKVEYQDNPVLPTTTGASDLSTIIQHNGHLADLRSYLEAIQRLRELYADADGECQCVRLEKVLQRPHHRGVRGRHLEGAAVSGAVNEESYVSQEFSPRRSRVTG